MYKLTPALGLRLEDPLCEGSAAIEKLFEDVPRRDRVFLDAAFEHKVDQAVSELGPAVPRDCFFLRTKRKKVI